MQSLLGSFLSNHKQRSVLSEQSRELDSPAVMTATMRLDGRMVLYRDWLGPLMF
jgi:hypothetical protein